MISFSPVEIDYNPDEDFDTLIVEVLCAAGCGRELYVSINQDMEKAICVTCVFEFDRLIDDLEVDYNGILPR